MCGEHAIVGDILPCRKLRPAWRLGKVFAKDRAGGKKKMRGRKNRFRKVGAPSFCGGTRYEKKESQEDLDGGGQGSSTLKRS